MEKPQSAREAIEFAATALVSGVQPSATVASDTDDPWVGTVVADRYRLLERLGAGGMGAVYRGEHVFLKKRVAVKFLHRELSSNKELVARFEREGRAAAHLDHPNIVAATDSGRLPDGTLFLVMDYVEGRSLRKVMEEQGRLPPLRVLRILRQVAAALHYAHIHGIVHRDLKPENVVVADRDGEQDFVKVIDFGIARVSDSVLGSDGTVLTQLGTVFGTPEYMSPEQVMGQKVDGRADQYTFGIMAFEMFTGRRPFQADDPIDLLRMHVGAPMPSVTQFAPDLPASLDAVIAKMTAKRPSERYESMASAMAAIEAAFGSAVTSPVSVQGSVPGPVTAAGPRDATWQSARESVATAAGRTIPNTTWRVVLGLVGLFALSVVLGLATSSRSDRSGGERARVAETAGMTERSTEVRSVNDRLASYARDPEVAEALARSWRGDVEGAVRVLSARRARDRRDGLAAYFLGIVYWNANRSAEALEQFEQALTLEPDLAGDATLTRAVVQALGSSGTAREAERLLRAAPLAQSFHVAEALADVAINGSSMSLRRRALPLARDMAPLLSPLPRARVQLRTASNCNELILALEALEALNSDAARDDVAAVRSGECEFLSVDDCGECLEEYRRGKHGH